MIFIYIANLIITVLVTTLLLIFKNLDSITIVLNIIMLVLSLEIPTFYLLLTNRKQLNKNDNELLAPSGIISFIAFIVNVAFYSIMIGIHSKSLKSTILFTIIFNVIIAVLMLITKSITNYIRKQH